MSALFLADRPALDFLNTVLTPRTETIEFLSNGEGLIDWLEQAGLIEVAEIAAIRRRFSRESLNSASDEARSLREWFRGVVQQRERGLDAKLSAGIVRRLNPILARSARHGELEVRGRVLVCRQRRRLTDVGQVLVPVAEAMCALLVEVDWSRIRRCANPKCTLWFRDSTKSARRLYCSAAVCGNRAKVAAYRARQQQGASRS
jgi:predicted RNA-binding Zn ribbon-like protein